MAVTKSANDKLLDQLAERFDAETEVGQREQGGKRLDYIGIDKTIARFNKVLSDAWSFEIRDFSLTRPPSESNYLAVVSGRISALGKVADGLGADAAKDPDKAIKTALAEALKKCSHQFGMALYLWNEDERNVVQQIRTAAASGDDLAPLKIRVMQKATDAGVEQQADKIAEHFGVTVEQLQDVAVLERILNG